MDDRIQELERRLSNQRRVLILTACLAIVTVGVGFVGPLAPPDPEAVKVTTPNLAATPTTRLQISGNEDTAKAAFLNCDVGIGTASPGEKLEVTGAVKIANATGTADGTIRWTGTDFEGRKGGAWVSLTSGGGGADISAKVKKSADQSIPNATLTVIAWDQEQYDTDAMHDVSVNNSRITFNKAGKYSLVAQGWWTSNATGHREMGIRRNGSQLIAHTGSAAISGTRTYQNCSMVFEMAVGDYCEVVVVQTSGAALIFLRSEPDGSQLSSFTVQKVDKGG
jgi:hypothetical protein